MSILNGENFKYSSRYPEAKPFKTIIEKEIDFFDNNFVYPTKCRNLKQVSS